MTADPPATKLDAAPSARPPRAPKSVAARRQRAFLIVAVAAAVIATAGLVVSLFVKSPAQMQAEQAPPSPGVLTASVTRQQLTQTVIAGGTVEPGATEGVRALSASGGGLRVVTGTPKRPGDALEAGQVLIEISGRPLIALPGSIPAYRDFVVGTRGPDVEQLQRALVSTGDLPQWRVSGEFDWWTQVAVGEMYDRLGYPSVGTGSSISLPLSEVVFVASLPATVATVAVQLGAPLPASGDPVATVNTGSEQVRAMVPQGQQVGIQAGQTVQMSDDVTGRQTTGTVVSVGAYTSGQSSDSNASAQQNPGTGGTAGGQNAAGQAGYPVIVQPSEPLGTDWLGANVRVQIVGAQTAGEVLVVPSSAIATDAAGGSSVRVRAADGSETTVPVRTGMIVGGLVEVTPVQGEALSVGDEVVTG